MTYSDAIKEAYASCPSDVALIETVEIWHPDWASVLRFVRGKEALTATVESNAPNNPGQAVLFAAIDFSITQPRIGEGRQELTLEVDNAPLFLLPLVEMHDLASLDEAQVIYRPYLSSDLTGPHMNPPLTLSIVGITTNTQTISVTCAYADIANRRFPRKVYTVDQFPGIAPRV